MKRREETRLSLKVLPAREPEFRKYSGIKIGGKMSQGHKTGDFLGPHKTELVDRWEVKPYKYMGLFICSFCGGWFETSLGNVSAGRTKSCGCKYETHGLRDTPYYNAFKGMWKRCTKPTHIAYPNYGGRGIKVCGRWRDITAYREDIDKQLKGQGLTLKDWGKGVDQYTLDRKDNDGDYEPGNIRFATPTEQANNKRNSKKRNYE